MDKEVEKKYSLATKIILDNWIEKEQVTLQKLQETLNISLTESKVMYESIMDQLIKNKV